ncbi:hypothetical protein C9419_16820 [Paraburkholderia fungorum]|nr:hypothetical protein C9419_16820 [Paraburkholderia fungorum]
MAIHATLFRLAESKGIRSHARIQKFGRERVIGDLAGLPQEWAKTPPGDGAGAGAVGGDVGAMRVARRRALSGPRTPDSCPRRALMCKPDFLQ